MINWMLVFVFIVGLCLGSFYNVVILRSISGESIILPPSKCPKCGNKLKPVHNIPVISYLLLGGKCAFCKEKISLQYPIVELVTAVLFCLIYNKFGWHYMSLLGMFWVSCLIIMTVTDIKTKLVDCNYAIAMGVSGLVYMFFVMSWEGGLNSLGGAILGYIIVEAVARIGYFLKKKRAMGEADSYLAAAFGAIVGYQAIIPVLLYSLAASMFFVLPVFWYNRYKDKDAMTLLLSALFIMSLAISIYNPFNYLSYSVLIFAGILLVVQILKTIRESSNLNYLPFVPALSAGFLYYLLLYYKFIWWK